MNQKLVLYLLCILFFTSSSILISGQDDSFFYLNYVNPFYLIKKTKDFFVSYGAGQQAIVQLEAQQKIAEITANNPGVGLCVQQMQRISDIGDKTNGILQSGLDVGKDIADTGKIVVNVLGVMAIGSATYRAYNWMFPSEDELLARSTQVAQNRRDLEFFLAKDITRCIQNNDEKMITRCNKVFSDYSRLVGPVALNNLKKSLESEK